jgi:hypothetical protein
MEDVGIIYGNLVYFTAIWNVFVDIWYILWLFVAPKNLATVE